jgi:formate hydrogenlyase subunit 6/NADH:ubiquinone oxidoreductase subunit I
MNELDAHEATDDPDKAYDVYDRYYRTGDTISEPVPVDYLPDRHRGLHYLETEKCIMCFQCARACPVDCIDIEGTRDGDVEGGHRGDKCTLTRFTIDYALCIFCDHCTLACPDKQVCIHMGKEYDLNSYDQGHLVKNLLTDGPFSKPDRSFVMDARKEIDRLADEKKKAREAAKAKPAVKPAAAPGATATATLPKPPETKPPETKSGEAKK